MKINFIKAQKILFIDQTNALISSWKAKSDILLLWNLKHMKEKEKKAIKIERKIINQE
jgi:ABC-type lipoprotein export system ATPase subunit